MKKILFLLLTVALFVNCDPKDTPDPKGKLDPNATILIRPAKGVQLRSANPEHLTALQIVEQTKNMLFHSHYGDNVYLEKPHLFGRGFSDPQRDYTIPALKMWGTDIINQNGEYVKDFIEGFDFVLTTNEREDTIAYIPNAVLANARNLIKKAYDDENYTRVYQLFDSVFTFIPITGTEWRALKAEDKQ